MKGIGAMSDLSGEEETSFGEEAVTATRATAAAAPQAPVAQARYSYSSTALGFSARCQELLALGRVALRPQTDGAAATVRAARQIEAAVFERTGVRLENLKVLEVGPGQQLRYMRCFAQKNEVIGIDTDVILQGLGPSDVLKMVRTNPWMRTLKTLGRVALGRDSRFLSALARELGVEKLGPLPTAQMNAEKMTFPEESFGFVFSCSVFEHIADPLAALHEVARVLRPGGVACISVHLYTSHSGQHDPRIFAAREPTPPFWPHLRPAFAHTVRPSAFLNRLSLKQWKMLFSAAMPGVKFLYDRDREELALALGWLRADHELSDYDDDELLTVNVIAIWQKPAAQTARPMAEQKRVEVA